MNTQDYSGGFNDQLDAVFRRHPEIYDHREVYPWGTGYLGNPFSGIWFVAEIPSLRRVETASKRKPQVLNEETQWSESPGDKLLREMLSKHGFKQGGPFSPGGWQCYITNVIKQTSYVKDWESKTQTAQQRTAEIWSPVLSWELSTSKPHLVVVMGRKTQTLLNYLEAKNLIRLPNTELIQHYAYIGSRPKGKLGPMHPERIKDYDAEFARIRKIFEDIKGWPYKEVEISYATILRAMNKFDAQGRQSFTSWGNYAIEHGGKNYPPKEILRMAAGSNIDPFSGVEETNKIFKKLGFSVIIIGHPAELKASATFRATKVAEIKDAIDETHSSEKIGSVTKKGEGQLPEKPKESVSPWNDINDEALRARLNRLGFPPLDTLIREAGVVLEDRIRRLAGESVRDLDGVALVDAALGPEKGGIRFSPHRGEQEGVRFLYRGAIQFIRNPPMHRLIEYQEGTAQLLLRLVDSLLLLLTEGEPYKKGSATTDDIRKMLNRLRIPNGQKALYKTLYAAGDRGLSSSELASAMGRTREQLSGVLGALGRRINNTTGLEGKAVCVNDLRQLISEFTL